MDEMLRDPNFRSQYDAMPKPDAEFEAVISGSPHGRIHMQPVSRPLDMPQMLGFVRLR